MSQPTSESFKVFMMELYSEDELGTVARLFKLMLKPKGGFGGKLTST